MTRLRSLLFYVLLGIWTVVGGIVFLPTLFLSRRVTVAASRVWCRGCLFLLRICCGLSHRLEGAANMGSGARLVAVKHQSAWETLALPILFPDPAIVLKKELLNLPIIGFFLRKCRMIPIDRKAGASALKAMVQAAKEAAEAGRPIVIFPEGTRTAPGEQRAYQPGVAALASQLKIPTVPVAHNSGFYWARESIDKFPGTIDVVVLPRIEPGLDRKTYVVRLRDEIEGAVARLPGRE